MDIEGMRAAPQRATRSRAASSQSIPLCEVLVHLVVGLLSLHELPLDKRLDALLDDVRADGEARHELARHLGDERVVLHLLSRLHRAHDGRLDLRLAVLVDLLPRLELLGLALALRRDGTHLELELLRREAGVEVEGVALVHVAALWLLGKYAELAARERLQRALQVGRRDLGGGGDVGVADAVRCVEEKQHAHLVSRNVDLVPASAEGGLELGGANVGLPGEPPVGVLLEVVLGEDVNALVDGLGQCAGCGSLSRPEAGGEHVHSQLNVADARGAFVRVAEGLLRVGRHLHVEKHALELGGELIAALLLELADHQALDVVGGRAAAEQPLGQMLLVILLEDVLLLQVAEEHHDFVEQRVNLLVRGAAHALAHVLVHEEGDVLWRSLVEVEEELKRLVERVVELLVPVKGALNDSRVLVAQLQQLLNVEDGLLAELLVAHELLAKPLDVLGHDLSHHAQPVGRHLDAPEEAVGALEVGGALVLEHRDDARVRHLGKRAHVLGDEFALRHLAQLGVGARVEVVRHALVLLSQPLLRLAHVVGGRVLANVLARLARIEFGSRLQKGLLEVLLVDLARELDEHLGGRLDEAALDHLARALSSDQVEQHRKQPLLDAWMSAHFVAEDEEASIIHRHLSVLWHVRPIHVHQNVADHY
mmetsp:Transcript_31817/g.61229  ORF Transcript_31817/g.61229 Transcript_31817/m.61229 type:complete len:652 (+) Transcript_31817:470-2425(+)